MPGPRHAAGIGIRIRIRITDHAMASWHEPGVRGLKTSTKSLPPRFTTNPFTSAPAGRGPCPGVARSCSPAQHSTNSRRQQSTCLNWEPRKLNRIRHCRATGANLSSRMILEAGTEGICTASTCKKAHIYTSGYICSQTLCCRSSRRRGRSPVICDTEPAARAARTRKLGARAAAAKEREAEEAGRSGNDTKQTR